MKDAGTKTDACHKKQIDLNYKTSLSVQNEATNRSHHPLHHRRSQRNTATRIRRSDLVPQKYL
jgi:hypothetical protein